nr:hypothetical protein [Borreliella andersonii]WNY66338.1 hypothetical protein QIA45_04460 [Borreliella andersonii]
MYNEILNDGKDSYSRRRKVLVLFQVNIKRTFHS